MPSNRALFAFPTATYVSASPAIPEAEASTIACWSSLKDIQRPNEMLAAVNIAISDFEINSHELRVAASAADVRDAAKSTLHHVTELLGALGYQREVAKYGIAARASATLNLEGIPDDSNRIRDAKEAAAGNANWFTLRERLVTDKTMEVEQVLALPDLLAALCKVAKQFECEITPPKRGAFKRPANARDSFILRLASIIEEHGINATCSYSSNSSEYEGSLAELLIFIEKHAPDSHPIRDIFDRQSQFNKKKTRGGVTETTFRQAVNLLAARKREKGFKGVKK
jgi:hypothetical protein